MRILGEIAVSKYVVGYALFGGLVFPATVYPVVTASAQIETHGLESSILSKDKCKPNTSTIVSPCCADDPPDYCK
jgi:hypothetical protein